MPPSSTGSNSSPRVWSGLTLAALLAAMLTVVNGNVARASTNPAGVTLPWGVGQAWSANGPHADNGGAGVRNAVDVTGGDGACTCCR